MSTTLPRAAEKYSPLYFLASLGAGGLSVTFFMYLSDVDEGGETRFTRLNLSITPRRRYAEITA